MLTKEQAFERAFSGEPLVNIGQLDDATVRALNREVKAGKLVKWRGHWFPWSGHKTYGMGPLKTCWAPSYPYTDGLVEQEEMQCN